MKLRDKLFFIVKSGQTCGNVRVAIGFENSKEIEEKEKKYDCSVRYFTNKKGSKRLYQGDEVGYLTACNDYNMR